MKLVKLVVIFGLLSLSMPAFASFGSDEVVCEHNANLSVAVNSVNTDVGSFRSVTAVSAPSVSKFQDDYVVCITVTK